MPIAGFPRTLTGHDPGVMSLLMYHVGLMS
jgi:hypothetical protein